MTGQGDKGDQGSGELAYLQVAFVLSVPLGPCNQLTLHFVREPVHGTQKLQTLLPHLNVYTWMYLSVRIVILLSLVVRLVPHVCFQYFGGRLVFHIIILWKSHVHFFKAHTFHNGHLQGSPLVCMLAYSSVQPSIQYTYCRHCTWVSLYSDSVYTLVGIHDNRIPVRTVLVWHGLVST